MELEKEIQQKKFKDQYQKLAVNLIYTGNWMVLQHARLLKPHGLTPQQYNVLRILRGQHPTPCTVGTIVERMLDMNSNASRILDRLVAKGLADRKQCPNDRREFISSADVAH